MSNQNAKRQSRFDCSNCGAEVRPNIVDKSLYCPICEAWLGGTSS